MYSLVESQTALLPKKEDSWGVNSRKRAEQEMQESASPPTQQLYRQNLSGFGILEFIEGLDNKLWSISALSSVTATHPPCKPWGRKLCIQLRGARIGKKDPALPILKMFLITDCCFWSERCHCCFTQPHPPLIQVPPPLAEGTSRGLKGLMPFPPHFSLFPLKDEDIQKQLHVWGKLESDWTCPEKAAAQKGPERIYVHTWSWAQRQPAAIRKTKQ